MQADSTLSLFRSSNCLASFPNPSGPKGLKFLSLLRILASYKAKKQQPLDILAYNSANKPSFKNSIVSAFIHNIIQSWRGSLKRFTEVLKVF